MATNKGKKPPKGGGNSIPAPTGLTAIALSPNSVELRWNPVTGATTYWIYRRDPSGIEYVPAIITFTNYIDPSAESGTTYSYSVAAVVNSQLGQKSAPVTVTTP